MEKYDVSQLTEFPRFESESNQSGVTMFFNKLLKFPLFAPSETAGNIDDKSLNVEKQTDSVTEKEDQEEYVETNEIDSYVEFSDGRSFPNVIKRISGLVAMGQTNKQKSSTRYADTELARYWMPDDISRECYECAARFGALRRRHHCRVCGQIFCSRCCSQRVPGQVFGCAGDLRVCTYCCNIVLSYLRENDVTGEISTDLQQLQENLQIQQSSSSGAGRSQEFMLGRGQEPSEIRSSSKDIHDVFRQLSFTLPTKQHRYRLVRYNNVWRGCDVMQWVMENTVHKTRAQASILCQSLVQYGYMERMTEPLQFADYGLYRPVNLACTADKPEPSPEKEVSKECSRLVESVSSYCLDLNLNTSSARLIKSTNREPVPASPPSPPSPTAERTLLENNDMPEAGSSNSVCRAIEECGAEHLALLLRQCLARHGVAAAPAWHRLLLPLCVRAAALRAPDMMSNDIDIRNYVQIKRVPGGDMSDSTLVHGVVVSKNVANRGMPHQISNPTILLLDCSIAYQRVEGKLTSLEPLLMQEHEYVLRCAARISALRPRVVLVRGAVARALQDALRDQGIALALGVRDRALRRTARCTKADLVASIDARIGTPRLGTCKNFYVKNYSGKTLMVFEGCAEPNLGCCILLRGGTNQELARVKKVVKFMLLACYNWRLEKAFLNDIEATLPEPGMSFVDDEDKDIIQKVDEVEVGEAVLERIDTNVSDESDDIFGNAVNDELIPEVDNNASDLENKIVKNDSENKTETEQRSDTISGDTRASERTATGGSESELDDPLQKVKHFGRKTDSDKNPSCGVPIRDFSDPLRSTVSVDDDVFLPQVVELKADTKDERWCTDDVLLSMSPNIVIPAPERPLPRAPPPHPAHAAPRPARAGAASRLLLEKPHPFIKEPITAAADELSVRRSLANFRATGCQIAADRHKLTCPRYNPSVVKATQAEESKQSSGTVESVDPLSPEHHQTLNLLIYSYSNKSPNVPDFCINPSIETMEMYGRHDITLGAFLEKYCFNGNQKCSSDSCPVPMNQHVRKFVHGDVCITITCNTIGHSSADKPRDDNTKQVMFWSRCETCGRVSHGVRLSRAALCLSLAQYVRWRARAVRYTRRMCAHPLHTHSHAFLSGLTTACFRYNKISTLDIQLPPHVISIDYDTRQMRDSLITHLNELMLKGHESLSVCEGDAEREYATFKQHTEHIHLALTSPHLHDDTDRPAVIRSLWKIYDSIIIGEKMLRDTQEKLTCLTAKSKLQAETVVEDRTDSEESTGESSTNDVPDASKELDKEHTGTEEEEERGDKKTVKQILTQLLTNNQPSNQGGMIITSGVIPVLVKAGEIGSVIAATLASVTYQLTLHQHRHSTQSEAEDSELVSSKERPDSDRTKAKSNNEHIEVLLKDGLVCRVYYALQFDRLRHMVLAPLGGVASGGGDGGRCCDPHKENDGKGLCEIEEGFIRSLAQCVPWATRGGKSGSTFCKTKDDRYVLKEMTKPEWTQFLEFAPHYFNYVTSCRTAALPTILARIVGVFSVGGAGVLVTEHVWYGEREPSARFDLKGASRHRQALGAASHPPRAAVLVDDNLLALRWERQLFVSSRVCAGLWRALERDSTFLAEHHVMDYSLLLGTHPDTLVLGIIDYIRTFTWDKKLEHLVKKNLGSGQPTVVSPEQYQRRFCEACRKYFLECPSHWDHLYREPTRRC